MRHGHLRQPRQGRATSLEGLATRVNVTRTYLELPDRGALRAGTIDSKRIVDERIRVERVQRPVPVRLYRELYRDVGAAYHWHDRDAWSDEQLAAHLAREAVTIWLLKVGDETAGYFELVAGDDGDTEIGYFGLVGRFIGRGLGKYLLTRAVEEAFAAGASRVWLHTCTLDDPAALPNYLARGFAVYKTEQYETVIGPA